MPRISEFREVIYFVVLFTNLLLMPFSLSTLSHFGLKHLLSIDCSLLLIYFVSCSVYSYHSKCHDVACGILAYNPKTISDPSHSVPLLPMFPLEFCGKVKQEETRRHGAILP